MRHFRIKSSKRESTARDSYAYHGGEWATYEAAAAWARQHIPGVFWLIVETDRHGNELR